jgi:hypothetical protein
MGIHLLALTMPKAIYFVKANLFAAQGADKLR